MRRLHKILLAMITLVFLSATFITPVPAQSIPEPPVPEFTVKYVDGSYYMPPVYGVDLYSGKTMQTGGGFNVYNKTILLTITPIPFTSYKDVNGSLIDLFYTVGYKGHFSQDWKCLSPMPQNDYNVIVFGLGSENSDYRVDNKNPISLGYLDAGDQIDFQVEAQIGYFYLLPGHDFMDPYGSAFAGETGDWSSTQTLVVPQWYHTMPAANATSTLFPTASLTSTSLPSTSPAVSESTPMVSDTSSPFPNASPTIPELTPLAVLPLSVAMLFIVAKLMQRKRANN